MKLVIDLDEYTTDEWAKQFVMVLMDIKSGLTWGTGWELLTAGGTYIVESEDPDPEASDWANGFGSDGEVDADALASAGMGTDEDYLGGTHDDYGL